MAYERSDDWVPLGRGKSSQVFRIAPGRVIKIFHAAVSEDMIQREMTAARIASLHHVPTAAPTERVKVGGLSALIYPEVAGPSLAALLRRQPGRAGALLARMADLQGTVHGHTAGDLRGVISVLATDIAYGPAPDHLKQAATDHLRHLPDGDRLLHGDFHLDNILVSEGQLVVLDWAKAAAGDPAADVVRSEMLMRFGEGPADPITALWRDWAARRLRTVYQRQAAMNDEWLALWRPVVALAWLRARPPVRNRAFLRYLNQALRRVGLPGFSSR